MTTITHAEIEGRHYYNVTAEDLQGHGIKQSVIDDVINDEKWKPVLNERNRRLFDTDWTQGQDSPFPTEKVSEFAVYRQALRDIPQNFDDPDAVVWPEKPTL